MCGIAGIYGPSARRVGGEISVRHMLGLIRHRGPDEAGVYLAERLCMGTARLSIVGVATGQQPMCDAQGRFALCYNGELYNYVELKKELMALGHRFVTTSDTEVVLEAWRAWGEDCLRRFNGAFGFAIYDREDDVLHLVRDRFGKRPLFYAKHHENLLFSSEMKSFLAIRDFAFELDQEQLASILTLWTPVGDQSGFKRVQQVPLGSYVRITSGQPPLVRRYHEMDFTTTRVIRSEAEALEEIRHTLSDAVRIRLRSDVEVGMYLSGGLDSSILASIVAEQLGEFRTYSVAFEDAEFDESPDQLRMARHVGSKHRSVCIDDAMIAENFPAAAYHAELPVFRTAFVPMYLLSRAVRDDGVKVVLTGEGADEAFLGYDLFKETLLRQSWSSLDDAAKLRGLARLYPYLKHYTETDAAQLLGLYQQFSQEQHAGLFSHELRVQNGLFSRRLLAHSAGSLNAITQLMAEHSYFKYLSATEKAQWLEYQSLLPGYLLSSQGDRMILAHSVENRCPFLDPRVIELASAVNLKFDDGTDEKRLLRKAFGASLPLANAAKRKHPYRAPDIKSFVTSRPDYLELLLSDSELRKNEILNVKFCRALVDKVFHTPLDKISTKENQTFIFLLSLMLLHQRFVKRASLAPVAADVHDILVKVVEPPRSATREAVTP